LFPKLAAAPGVGASAKPDPRLGRVLWQLVGGTRGGPNRAKIIEVLANRPLNANQLSEQLQLDYKTVNHHLKVLALNRLIEPAEPQAYGAMYFLTPLMQESLPFLQQILAKIGSK
jgi:DNA-binding transcriptional ArsR family regulator